MKRVALLLVLLVPTLALGATDAEQRCRDMLNAGNNPATTGFCYCSEPLQATHYTQVLNGSWNADDSTLRECTIVPGFPGVAIETTAGQSAYPIPGNDPAVLAKLPTGHSVLHYMTRPEANVGSFDILHNIDSTTAARTAARWYQFYSSNFVWSTADPCPNSGKWSTVRGAAVEVLVGSFGNGHHLQGGFLFDGFYHLFYAWGGRTDPAQNWQPAANSGASPDWGPGSAVTAKPTIYYAGKWVRYEMVLTRNDTSGTPSRLVVYAKEINTGNTGIEEIIVDTAVPCTQPQYGPGCSGNADRTQDWTATVAANLKVPQVLVSSLGPEMFRRESVSGGCPGYQAVSHYMVAGWSTDAGQRIGAAIEIEGGGGGTGPPPVTDLTVTTP